jgi:hypothetical protein
MPLFSYVGFDSRTNEIRGEIQADSAKAALGSHELDISRLL